MRRCLWAAALMIGTAAVLFSAEEAQDSVAAEIARIEGPQSPSRQGFDPYTIPEMMKRFHVPGVSTQTCFRLGQCCTRWRQGNCHSEETAVRRSSIRESSSFTRACSGDI